MSMVVEVSECPKRKVTIFTSSVLIGMLKINERIVDRIFSMCIRLNLPEKSIRAMRTDAENMKFMKNVLK